MLCIICIFSVGKIKIYLCLPVLIITNCFYVGDIDNNYIAVRSMLKTIIILCFLVTMIRFNLRYFHVSASCPLSQLSHFLMLYRDICGCEHVLLSSCNTVRGHAVMMWRHFLRRNKPRKTLPPCLVVSGWNASTNGVSSTESIPSSKSTQCRSGKVLSFSNYLYCSQYWLDCTCFYFGVPL